MPPPVVNPEDIVLLETPDPDNPGQIIRQPLTIPRERQAEILRTNPDLAAVLRPTSAEELRALAELQDADRRREVIRSSPIFSRLAAFGLNFANEMSLGLTAPDPGSDEARTAAVLGEERGLASALGTGAGIIGPALATGGSSLAEAGGAALVPGVLAQAAGNSVERLLFRNLIQRGVSPAAARALSITGGATVDGGLSGLQAAITSSNIEGTPLDAETILANVGLGAGLGLGTGGLMSARLGRRARQQATQLAESGMGHAGVEVGADGSLRLIPQTNPEATGLVADALSSRAVRTISGLTAEGDDLGVRRLAAPGAMAEAQAGHVYTREAQDLSARLSESVTRARNEAIEPLRTASFRQSRFGELAGAEDVAGPLRRAMEGSAALLDDIAETGAQRLGPEAGKARRTARLVRAAAEAADAPTLAARLDDLLARARVDRLDEGIADPDLAYGIRTAIRQAEEGLARMGPAGEAAVRAQHAVRDYDLAMRDLRSNSLTKHNISLDEERFNPGALFASVSDSGFRVKQDFTEDLALLNSRAAMAAKVAEDLYGLAPTGVRAELEAATAQLSELKRKGELIATLRDLQSRESRGAGLFAALGLSGAGMGATVGGVLGGLPGAALGAVVGGGFAMASHPVSALQRLGFLGNAKRSVQARLKAEVGGLRRALESGRRFRKIQAGSRAVPRLVAALKSKEERREQYEAVTEQLRQLASNPEGLMDTLAEATGGVEQVSPEMASYMANAYVRGVQYLVSNLPPADAPSLFGHLQDLEPSDAEINAFVRRFEAIEDPLSIVSMAAEFSLTPEHVQAVRSVYPELYTAIQAEITNMLGNLTKLPPYSARMMVGTLLDVPADPSLDSQFIFRLQQRYAQTGQQQQEIGPRQTTTGAKRLASNTYSASQSISIRLNGGT